MTTGRALRDAGMAQSMLPLSDGAVDTFDSILAEWADSGVPFTSDNLRQQLDDAGIPESSRGALFSAARKRGVIVPIGYVQSTHPATHAHPVRQWIGAQWHRAGVA